MLERETSEQTSHPVRLAGSRSEERVVTARSTAWHLRRNAVTVLPVIESAARARAPGVDEIELRNQGVGSQQLTF